LKELLSAVVGAVKELYTARRQWEAREERQRKKNEMEKAKEAKQGGNGKGRGKGGATRPAAAASASAANEEAGKHAGTIFDFDPQQRSEFEVKKYTEIKVNRKGQSCFTVPLH
jgi:hypothetical protein